MDTSSRQQGDLLEFIYEGLPLITVLPYCSDSSVMFCGLIQLPCTVVLSYNVPTGFGRLARTSEPVPVAMSFAQIARYCM